MKRILHILKKEEDRFPLEVIRKEAAFDDVTVLLIQKAVSMRLNGVGGKIFVLKDDAERGNGVSYPQIGYKEMLDLIFSADNVVTW